MVVCVHLVSFQVFVFLFNEFTSVAYHYVRWDPVFMNTQFFAPPNNLTKDISLPKFSNFSPDFLNCPIFQTKCWLWFCVFRFWFTLCF